MGVRVVTCGGNISRGLFEYEQGVPKGYLRYTTVVKCNYNLFEHQPDTSTVRNGAAAPPILFAGGLRPPAII